MTHDISVCEAREAVLAAAHPLDAEEVGLAEALGRVLAEGVRASFPIPPFDASAMDGVAVRAEECAGVPVTLPLAGASWAGAPFEGAMPPGSAVQIATGAVVPSEADAVVPVEWTDGLEGSHVRVHRQPAPGHAIRLAGSAVNAGADVATRGTRITPATIGALATVGAARVSCVRQPVVRIVVTGDEVVPAGGALRRGQIHDANGPMLSAQVREAGGIPEMVYAGDDKGALADVLRLGADVILLTGGVSVGARDRVRAEGCALGVRWAFWRVRQRPGKPLLFGSYARVPVFGLPGNPVSASVGFEVYVRPALAAMQGAPEPPRRQPAQLAEDIPKPDGLHTFARVTAHRQPDGRLLLRPVRSQASHAVLSLLGDGLAHLPADWREAPVGAEVSFEPFSWSRPC